MIGDDGVSACTVNARIGAPGGQLYPPVFVGSGFGDEFVDRVGRSLRLSL
jgi:hypothetical protein